MPQVDMTAPVDECHAISIRLTGLVNEWADTLRERIAVWEPRPCPPRGKVRPTQTKTEKHE